MAGVWIEEREEFSNKGTTEPNPREGRQESLGYLIEKAPSSKALGRPLLGLLEKEGQYDWNEYGRSRREGQRSRRVLGAIVRIWAFILSEMVQT